MSKTLRRCSTKVRCPASSQAPPRERCGAPCCRTAHQIETLPAVTAEWQRGEEDVDRMKAESAMLKISLLMAFDPRLEDQVRALLAGGAPEATHSTARARRRTTHSPWLPAAAPAHFR